MQFLTWLLSEVVAVFTPQINARHRGGGKHRVLTA